MSNKKEMIVSPDAIALLANIEEDFFAGIENRELRLGPCLSPIFNKMLRSYTTCLETTRLPI
jgi:hypothetical protein